MKRLSSSLSMVLVALTLVSGVACQSSKPKKKVPVPPPAGQDVSGLSWSRPQKFESNGGLSGAMPQSR